jgi:MFS family permease
VPDTARTVDAASAEPTRLRDAPRYLWVVFASAFLGWAFDAMDLNLFTLILVPTVQELTGSTDPAVVAHTGGLIIALKLFAWGVGGVAFGFLTDRYGRARILIITVAIYTVFTGLSAVATSVWQLALFQMLAGLGIGGEWAAGAALLAETWPEKLRAKVMQLMQMGFPVGFFLAAVINQFVGPFGWRWVFLCGLLPVLLTIFIRRFVREPERWERSRRELADAPGTPPLQQLIGPRLRRSTVVGMLAGIAMMIGFWGGTTWLPSWIAQLAPAGTAGEVLSTGVMLMNAGAFAGYVALMWLAGRVGRKVLFALYCGGALVASLVLFTQATTITMILLLLPLYGFFTMGGFGVLAVYLPELFPTVVRASGQGLCWNLARILTGFGVLAGGLLVGTLGSLPAAAAAVSAIYVLGLVAIWFGPETRGRQLQDF